MNTIARVAPVRRLSICAGVLALALAALPERGDAAVAANFDGQMLEVTQTIIGTPDPVETTTFLVGASAPIENFGFLDLTVDITATMIEILGNATIAAGPNVFGISFADNAASIARITGTAVATQQGFSFFDAGNVQIVDAGETILIDFDGVGIALGDRLVLDVSFAEAPAGGVVPLPATLPLALGGFAVLAGLGRRRR